VETPIRKGVLGRSWRAWREAQGCRKCRLGWQWAAASVSVAAVVSFLGLLLLRAHPPPVPDYLAVAIAPRSLPPAAVAIPRVIESNAPPVGAAAAKPSPAAGSATNGATPVTAIGDSVMLGVSEELQTVLNGNVIVDADQGRLPWKMNKLLQNLALERKSNSTVIVHIGNNGIFTADMFAQMMGELKHARRVVVVNLKVPRTWEGANNAMLAEAVKRYTNAVLVDWHGASRNRPELFWKDGLHLRPNGAKVYAALLAQAVAATNAASTELRLAAAGR
jgi:lysophospholipase L1-like esterase